VPCFFAVKGKMSITFLHTYIIGRHSEFDTVVKKNTQVSSSALRILIEVVNKKAIAVKEGEETRIFAYAGS
jgi:hypothetical protein